MLTESQSQLELRQRLATLDPAAKRLDAWPTATFIINGVKGQRGEALPSRVRYNLACLLTTLASGKADEMTPALEELRHALEGGASTRWAREDPSLAPLRKHCRREFDQILAAAPGAPSDPKAGDIQVTALSLIGGAFTETLGDRGISIPADLVAATKVDKAVEELATACDVAKATINRWRDQARIATLEHDKVPLGVEVANLLADAGIGSVDTLQAANAAELATRLKDLNRTTKRLKEAPGTSVVQQWIDAAKKALPAPRAKRTGRLRSLRRRGR